jgi:uncharacterized iron-regulated membrane protein
VKDPQQRSVAFAAGALFATSATLICCVLPAALVSLGAGAAVVGLVTAVPQLVWLSEHKAGVFGIAGAFLIVSGTVLWASRRLPCPADPAAARSCRHLRRISVRLYVVAAVFFALGALFTFVLPRVLSAG